MSDDCCSAKAADLKKLARAAGQRRVLIVVLAINAVMFVVEFGAGLAAGSTALMADAADMFADALVYGVSIYAVARGSAWKAVAALLKGVFIFLLGVGAAVNGIVRAGSGVAPSFLLMLAVGGLALAANLFCLMLLWRFRSQDVNMASTVECSRNDVISNVGVLVAGVLVAWLNSPWPDILIGSVIAAILLRSALRVIGQASEHVLNG